MTAVWTTTKSKPCTTIPVYKLRSPGGSQGIDARGSIVPDQYQEGAVNFLDVIDADRTVLQSQRAAAQLTGLQAVSTVNLIRALGGGWSTAPALANTNE
jgi:hypothetical protein